MAEGLGVAVSEACFASLAANGLTSFFGCSLMGVYAVPTGPILSSSAGFVGTFDAGAGADAAGVKRAAGWRMFDQTLSRSRDRNEHLQTRMPQAWGHWGLDAVRRVVAEARSWLTHLARHLRGPCSRSVPVRGPEQRTGPAERGEL